MKTWVVVTENKLFGAEVELFSLAEDAEKAFRTRVEEVYGESLDEVVSDELANLAKDDQSMILEGDGIKISALLKEVK